MNILLYAHGLVSKQQPRPARLWHKKSSVSLEAFFVYLFSFFFFHPLSVWHNVQKCWAAYIPPLPIHVQKIYFFILVKIRLFYLFDWPSMNEDFSKKKKKRKVIISQSSPHVFSTEAVVTVNALKSSHVFPKTALEKDSDYTCAAVKGFLTPAVRRAHYFERLLTFSWSSQSEPFTVNETSLPETRVSFCVFQYLLHEKVCILKLRTKKKKTRNYRLHGCTLYIYSKQLWWIVFRVNRPIKGSVLHWFESYFYVPHVMVSTRNWRQNNGNLHSRDWTCRCRPN